ncbi:DUF6752 domain-containing protein [Agromyces cerinus subsp. nitratus]|uniref:DUF6752 domain-containing protein n=2 Tax=Agromyces cerinus TaxID=33878 RepID=UPI0036351C4A
MAVRRLMRRSSAAPQPPEIARLESEIAALRGEIDELRADSRRIAELYDLVFERLRSDAGDESARH